MGDTTMRGAALRVARPGWLVVALAMGALSAAGVFNTLWVATVDGQPLFLLTLPVNLVIGYWLVVGAWRRASGG